MGMKMTEENSPVRKIKFKKSTINYKISVFKLQLSYLYQFKETISGKAKWKLKVTTVQTCTEKKLKDLEETIAIRTLCETLFL